MLEWLDVDVEIKDCYDFEELSGDLNDFERFCKINCLNYSISDEQTSACVWAEWNDFDEVEEFETFDLNTENEEEEDIQELRINLHQPIQNEKFRTYIEKSERSESVYYNFEILDQKLLDEFEIEVGNVSEYSVRLSNHKRPAVVSGAVANEWKYLYDTENEEVFKKACEMVDKVLIAFCDGRINVEEVNDMFNVWSLNDIENVLEKEF